jgi:hypothetical protein
MKRGSLFTMKMVQLMKNIHIIYPLSSFRKDLRAKLQQQIDQKKNIDLSGIIHIYLTGIREIKKDHSRFSKMLKPERIKLNLSLGQEILHQRLPFTLEIHYGEKVITLCHQKMLMDTGVAAEAGVMDWT